MASLGKKYLMALSGLVLSFFVLGHMLGNLLVFWGPEALNRYAFQIHSLPAAALWGVRLFLLTAALVHVITALVLKRENRKARAGGYAIEATVQASMASRSMMLSGALLLAFILFHLLHYTLRVVYDYDTTLAPYTLSSGKAVFDVYAMLISGFSHLWVSSCYIISVGFLCLHLSHGVSSLFQSLGLRNRTWRKRLDRFALAYGWTLFLGFASIPSAVLAGALR